MTRVQDFSYFVGDRWKEEFSICLLIDLSTARTTLSQTTTFIKDFKSTMSKNRQKSAPKGQSSDRLNWVETDLSDSDKAVIKQAGDAGLPDLLGAIGLVLHDGGNFSIRGTDNDDFRATIIWTATDGKSVRKFGISSVSPLVQYAVASVLHKYLVVLGGADEPPAPSQDETPLFT